MSRPAPAGTAASWRPSWLPSRLPITAVLFVMPRQQDDSTAPATAQPQTQPEQTDDPLAQLARREADDPMALGREDAPVVMINYSEFQCPFCGKFARDTEPTLVRDYVDKGILRIEWRDFPYLGQESLTAAQAGRAAGAGEVLGVPRRHVRQAVPAEQRTTDPGPPRRRCQEGRPRCRALHPGHDVASCGGHHPARLQGRAGDRRHRHPAFIINGQPVIGAQPTAEFVRVIEQAAKQAQ